MRTQIVLPKHGAIARRHVAALADGCRSMRRCSHAALSTFVALVLGLAPAVQAQQTDEADPFAGVEEMIVVGSGTAALLAPTSTSAIAFDSAELDAKGVGDLSDLSAYIPNLEIRSQNTTNASFFIRGVGLQDFGANASSSVPIIQDGIARNPSATQLVGLYDIEGLSALRGPQGAGNFRNASAGAIVVKTVKPSPEFSGFANVTLAQIYTVDARDARKYDFEAAVGAPVFEDIVSVRLAARYAHEYPWFENRCANRVDVADRPVQQRGANAPYAGFCGERVEGGFVSEVEPFIGRYIGEIDDFGFRGGIRIQPPDSGMDFTFRVELSRLNRESNVGQHLGTGLRNQLGGEDNRGYSDRDNRNRLNEIIDDIRAQPGNGNLSRNAALRLAEPILGREIFSRPLDQHPYTGDFDTPGRLINETHAASMEGSIEFDAVTLDIAAGFLDYRKSERQDTDLSPNATFPSRNNDQAWETYVSTELSGETLGDLPLDWKVGFYNLIEQVEASSIQRLVDSDRTTNFQQEIYSWGVFSEARYEFLESFTLAAGVRYNWERKDFEVDDFRLAGATLLTSRSRNQRTWDALTGFGEIRYDFTEDLATYLKYTRGFKAGHFNPSRAPEAKLPNRGFADPEQIDAFEWGLDFSYWASRITGNANLFFYNYKNYQVFRLTSSVAGIFRVIQNSRQARNYGAELEFTATPLEGFVPAPIERLSLNVRAGWLETSFVEFTNAEDRDVAGQRFAVTIDYSGNQLLSAPNLQVSGTIAWPLDLGRLGELTPIYDFTWTDDTPFDPNQGRGEISSQGLDFFSPYHIGNRAYILHNVRLQWQPAGDPGLTVAGWCRNVTDERYKSFSVDLSSFNNQQLHYVGDPRICGFDMRFTF